MHCDIYRSSKKDEMYMYIARPNYPDNAEQADPFENVPEAVLQAFGRATFVMHLELAPTRKLARVNVFTCFRLITNKRFLYSDAARRVN